MAFEPADSTMLNGLAPGDQVHFTLQKQGERLILVAIEKGWIPNASIGCAAQPATQPGGYRTAMRIRRQTTPWQPASRRSGLHLHG